MELRGPAHYIESESMSRRVYITMETRKVDPALLELLVCPMTKEPLEFNAAAGELIRRRAGLAFPIRDGIPIMLVDEARQLEENE